MPESAAPGRRESTARSAVACPPTRCARRCAGRRRSRRARGTPGTRRPGTAVDRRRRGARAAAPVRAARAAGTAQEVRLRHRVGAGHGVTHRVGEHGRPPVARRPPQGGHQIGRRGEPLLHARGDDRPGPVVGSRPPRRVEQRAGRSGRGWAARPLHVGAGQPPGPVQDHPGRRVADVPFGRHHDVDAVAGEAAQPVPFEGGQAAQQRRPVAAAPDHQGGPPPLLSGHRTGVGHVHAAVQRPPAAGGQAALDGARRQVAQRLPAADDLRLAEEDLVEHGEQSPRGR